MWQPWVGRFYRMSPDQMVELSIGQYAAMHRQLVKETKG